MGAVKEWSIFICIACTICILVEFLIPPGEMEKTMNMILGVFMLCALIFPFSNLKKFTNFKLENVLKTRQSYRQGKILDNMKSQIETVAEKNIQSIILHSLKNIDVSPKKVEIFMDTNDDNCIVMIRCKIYVGENSEEVRRKIKNEVEGRLGIKADVIY